MLDVIICTIAPRAARLRRVLDCLRQQTLDADKWSLLIVDNGPDPEAAGTVDLGWHGRARIVREPNPGLTHARLRGIGETSGALIVFVDDDNCLAPDYLEKALMIAEEHTYIGCFGGSIQPEFENEPPAWTRPFWHLLAIRNVDRDRWANAISGNPAVPCGAGLCVRREAAERYAETIQNNHMRLELDRKGDSLSSGGDTDLVLTACDLGLATGEFVCLSLIHLIPAARLQLDYLLRLQYAMCRSGVLLEAVRNGGVVKGEEPWQSRCKAVLRGLLMPQLDRRFYFAARRGASDGKNEVAAFLGSDRDDRAGIV